MRKKSLILMGISCLICIGMAFTIFNTSLTVNSPNNLKSAIWEIKFTNLSKANLNGNAQENEAPTINTNDTNISDYTITLMKPGDSASYTFDVVNNGNLDAEISTVTVQVPTCTGRDENGTSDATNVCKNLTYILTYADDSEIKIGDELKKDETRTMKLTLTYDSIAPAEEIPVNEVIINNLGATILYSQK